MMWKMRYIKVPRRFWHWDLTKHAICLSFFVASGILDHFGLRESQVQGLLHLLGNPEKVTIVPFDFDFIHKKIDVVTSSRAPFRHLADGTVFTYRS